jgi:hypothetical protein
MEEIQIEKADLVAAVEKGEILLIFEERKSLIKFYSYNNVNRVF